MEILEMKNTVTRVRSSVNELRRRLELTEESISEHAHRTTELVHSKQQSKTDWERRATRA